MEITDKILWYPQPDPRHGHIVQSSIIWNSDRPLEVTLVFIESPELSVTWVFSRDLFRQARQDGAAGDGDVQVKVRHGTVILHLTTPFGSVVLATADELIRRFTDKVYEVIPWEDEPDILSFSDDDLKEWLSS